MTCRRCQCGAHLCRGGSGGRALGDERGFYHQLDLHGAQLTVGVRGDIAVRHQLVAVPEVPQEVDGGGGAQVTTWVV